MKYFKVNKILKEENNLVNLQCNKQLINHYFNFFKHLEIINV